MGVFTLLVAGIVATMLIASSLAKERVRHPARRATEVARSVTARPRLGCCSSSSACRSSARASAGSDSGAVAVHLSQAMGLMSALRSRRRRLRRRLDQVDQVFYVVARYWRAMWARSSASGSLMSSPLTSTVTVWRVPVNLNGLV